MHEVVAGAIPYAVLQPPRPEIVTRARIVAVTVRRTPAPVAISTPRPTLRPRAALAVQRLPITRAYKGGRGGGPPHRTAPIALPARVAYSSRPVWDVRGASAGSGPALS
ncbi:MAG: hypothetical protein WB810_11915, partial [Candidatus Cybelea sp.]